MWSSFWTYRRDVHPYETDTTGRLFVVDVFINWPSNRNWQTEVLDSWEATQLNVLRQESVKMTILTTTAKPISMCTNDPHHHCQTCQHVYKWSSPPLPNLSACVQVILTTTAKPISMCTSDPHHHCQTYQHVYKFWWMHESAEASKTTITLMKKIEAFLSTSGSLRSAGPRPSTTGNTADKPSTNQRKMKSSSDAGDGLDIP